MLLLLVYYAVTWATFKPKLKKVKRIQSEGEFFYFRKWNFFVTKNAF